MSRFRDEIGEQPEITAHMLAGDGYGCRMIGIFDGEVGGFDMESLVAIDSGLPEDLTPLPLAVLGQLLAHRVAVARGIDQDRPRALNKVTRTW